MEKGKIVYSPDYQGKKPEPESMKKLRAYEEIIEETIKGARKIMRDDIVAAIERSAGKEYDKDAKPELKAYRRGIIDSGEVAKSVKP